MFLNFPVIVQIYILEKVPTFNSFNCHLKYTCPYY
uniref:Uncharacterized protein n=1 Tax=Heterorhabditis bacteriophora TaxID=37862 RepID=A0A1I7WIB3_HETBA